MFQETSGSMISTIIMFAIIGIIIYFIVKKYKTSTTPVKTELDGKYSLWILNFFAVVNLLGAIVAFLVMIFNKSDDTYVYAFLLIGCLFSYASLNALIVLINNVIQIRKNTEK